MATDHNERRRTKIVATLGPSTDDPRVLRELLEAGLNVARINFSHGDADERARRVAQVRELSHEMGRDVAVLGDLQGPKIRVERFRDGSVTLEEGATFALDAALGTTDGDATAVGIAYKNLPNDVSAGDMLMLDDGQIVLQVDATDGTRIDCTVVQGGRLSNNKGINRQGGGRSAGALPPKDKLDIVEAARKDVDYLAVSFPRDADDIVEARRLMREAGGHAFLVAKIERAEAVDNIDAIIKVSDAVMVARGDLGVEIGDAELPGVQKNIIERTRDLNRVVITATQMMESMVSSPLPTRAEVLDVANAVLDGTDAVMLSQETAVGQYPVKTVQAMARVCKGAERHRSTQVSGHRLEESFEFVDEAIAMATMYTANHFDVKAIVALTESGSTALWMSRIRSGIPVFALTRHETTRRRVTLYRGVYPVPFDVTESDPADVVESILSEMKRRGIVDAGDRVILTQGELEGVEGGTNTMRILAA